MDLNILAVMKQLAELQVALQKQVGGLGLACLGWLCLVRLHSLACLHLRACACRRCCCLLWLDPLCLLALPCPHTPHTS